jgi:YD repeat-containing protein
VRRGRNTRGQTTTYTHDMMGNVASVTDPDGNTTSYTYDALCRLVQETDPLGHSEYYQYDLSGNLTETIDRDGRVTEYTYDALDRETHEYWYASQTAAESDPNHTNAEDTFSYTYDLNNDLLTASDASSTYTYEYDADGRVTETDAQLAGLTPTVSLTQAYGTSGLTS